MELLKKYIRKFLMHHPGLRVKVREVHVAMKQRKYARSAAAQTIDDHLVIFETFMGRQYGCNPRAIYEYMLNDPAFDDYRFVWVLNDPEKKKEFPQLDRAETVALRSAGYYDAYARAKYVITNSNLDYGIMKREGQIFLQTWHGTPLKKLRCDIEATDGNAMNSLEEIRSKNNLDVVRYDYFIAPSDFAAEKFASAFRLTELGRENILIRTGYPRNDLMQHFDADYAAALKRSLGIPEDKKVILYAPTFRDNQHNGAGYVYELALDFDRLRRELGEEYVILLRVHYFVARQFDFDQAKGFVYDVSSLDDITPLYTIADLLITDYSSVFFDYANLRRPMIFYMYDKQAYANDIRGFYIDLEELPGPIVETEDDLISAIKRAQQDAPAFAEKYEAFHQKYNSLDDGNASRRVAEILFEMNTASAN